MKTIREVCNIAGVTRRTLQEYDRIGLLSPSNKDLRKNDNDAWLYSDEDIWKLIQIQTLIASGMIRKEVQRLLADPEFKMDQTLKLAIENLIVARARLYRLIRNLESLRDAAWRKSFEEMDPEIVFMTHSFKEYLDADDLQIVRWSTGDLL